MFETLSFVTLDEDAFEDLCCDLFQKEPEISTADRFGVRGQRQHGIDIRAYRRDGTCEIGQCKRYALFTKTDLETASAKFRASQNIWSSWRVQRFIIFVACSVRNRNVQDRYQELREAFEKEDIVLELWGDTSIAGKLRDQRPIAEKYFGGEKLRALCGSLLTAGTAQFSPAEAARGQVMFADECSAEFEGEAEMELRELRELARCGKRRSAGKRLGKLRSSPRWVLLSLRTRAQLWRLAASLALDCDGDVEAAKNYVSQGRKLDERLNYQVIESAIALHQSGVSEALKVLGEPRDVDALNIQFELLLQTGATAEVLKAVDKPPFEPNGGTYRLASVAAVLTKDPENAERFAVEALKRAPSWYLVRAQAAKVKYLRCLLPHFPIWHQLDWPVPPKSEYVKADSQSIELLENAAEEFTELLKTVEISDNERRLLEAWRLACLSCNSHRRDEAGLYASQLIANDPNHVPAVIWSIQKGFDFDRRSFFAALKGQRARNNLLAGDVQAVISALFQDGKFQEAIEILEAAKPAFESQNVGFLWRFLRGQLAASQQDAATTTAVLLEEQDIERKRDLQLAILRINANRTYSFKELGHFLEDCYHDTSKPAHLFEACEVWLRSGQPRRVVKHSEALLRVYPTATALRLVVQACFDANEFEVCAQLLRDRRDLFPGGDLPPVLRRLEIECLRQQGELTDAASIAEGLAGQQRDTETLLTLFRTQVSLGDLRAGSITARNLANRPEIAPFGLLQVARLVQSEDQALAVSLWEEAVRRGVDDPPALVTAVDLGFRLGLDDRLQPLMPKFYALSQQPGSPVSVHALDDIRALMEKVQKDQADVVRLYGQGAIPLHLVAGRINIPFAILLCEQGRINANARQPLCEPPLLIRAGSKVSASPRLRKPHRLMVDISSLLIADFLGVLDTVEAAFSPLLISAHVPEFLHEQIEKTLPHQPARQARRESVIKFLEERRLGTVSLADLSHNYGHLKVPNQLLLEHAKSGKRVVCDFAPPLSDDFKPQVLAPDDVPFFITCSDLARAMFAIDAISQAELDRANAHLLPLAIANDQFKLIPEQEIVLAMGVAEHLYGAGLLEILTGLSHVVLPEEDVQSLRAESEGHQSRLRAVDWLKTLQERVRGGLIKGTYKTVHRQGTGKEKVRSLESPAEHCVWDLLNAKAVGARVVWCDDRFLSRYKNVGKLASVGIVEILRLLRNDKKIDQDRYFSCLMRLRDANARYLPVLSEEVSYHLARAPIASGAVTETPALAMLRRYIAACCLDKERLQPPFVADGKQLLGEFNWVIEGTRAIAESITKLWEQESDDDQLRETRADWLLNNLFVPYLAVFDAQGRPPLDDGLEGYAGMIALLLSAGFYLPSPWSKDANAPATPRVKFYKWVESRFLAGIQHIEPMVIKRLAEIETNSLAGLAKVRGREKLPEKMMRALISKALLDLPQLVQSKLSLSGAFRDWLRLNEPRDMMGINGHEFEAANVYKAMAAACEGKSSKFKSETGDEFEIPPRDPSLPTTKLYIKGPGLPDKATLQEPRLPVLIGTVEDREKFLTSKTAWFDTGRDRTEKVVNGIMEESDPIRIFERIDAHRERSAEKFYRSLFDRLRNQETVRLEESFPANATSLIDHLRLAEENFSSSNVCFEACAERLIGEIGLGPALERFATLPVLLPGPFWKNIRGLSSEALEKLISVSTRRLLNPVARIHLIHILADRSGAVPKYLNKAKDVLTNVLHQEEGHEKWETFAGLLEWTHRVFQLRHDFKNLDPAVLLTITWLHAGRLCDTLLGAGIDQPKVRKAVRNAAESIGLDLAAHNKVLWFDAAHPRNVARLPLLLRGIGTVASAVSPEACVSLRLDEPPWKNPTLSAALLLRDTSLAGNLLNSFLGGNATAPLRVIFTESAMAKVQPLASGEVVEKAIRELAHDVKDLSRWHVVNLLIGDLPLPEPSASLLQGVIERTAFADLLKDKSESDHLIFHFACGRVAAGMADDVRTHLEEELFKLVQSYKGMASSDSDLRNRGGLAISCLLHLVMNASDEKDLFRRYHESLTKIVWHWPEIRKLVAQRFGGWPLNKPLVRQRGFWEMELTLRALA